MFITGFTNCLHLEPDQSISLPPTRIKRSVYILFIHLFFSQVNFLSTSPANPNSYANIYNYMYLNMGIRYSTNGVRDN